MPWLRAALVWMLFMLAETGSGMVREVFIAPVIGGSARATDSACWWAASSSSSSRGSRRAGWAPARDANSSRSARSGCCSRSIFEFALGRATGASWSRILSDYNPAHGGFMLLGLAFMFITPWLTRKLR